jgi:hypothetical protein
MTVTIVFGKTSDAYVHTYNATYATARSGPASGVDLGNGLYTGQHFGPGSYGTFEAFVGYDYATPPANEVITAANLRLYTLNMLNTALAQDIEWRGYLWSTGGVVIADWRTPAQLAAARLDGITHVLSGAVGKMIQTSSDELLGAMRPVASMEHVVTTNRMRAGTTPTTDEAIAFSSADEGGTSFDPQMVYTSAPRSTLFGVMGAQAEVSDGWVWLESNGLAAPTITLKYRPFASATVTTIATIPVNTTGTNTFQTPEGAQGLALVADPSDNLFVLGRLAATEISLAVLPFKKGAGTTWTAIAMRSTTMPTYGSSINQVVAIWHPYGSGSIVAFVEHIGSAGDSVTHNELQHAIFDVAPLLANTGNGLRASGNSMPGLGFVTVPSGYFNNWHNETGSGMDLVTPSQNGGSTDQAYLYSWGTNARLGDDSNIAEAWYILNPTSTGFQWTKTLNTATYGRKDAAAKLRALSVSSQAAAFISTDSDSGWGLTIDVRNHTGTDSTSLGQCRLADEGIASMPDGPVIAQTSAWDAVYNAIENRVWVYYVDAADAGKLRRTAFDLSTMNATHSEVTVYDDPGAATITAVRVQRNKGVGQKTLVTLAMNTAGTLSTVYVVDAFNIAPTAPTLAVKANHDASTAQVYSWTFNDPNPGDTQSAYQLVITNAATAVVALDTGKVASTVSSRNVAASTIANGASYTWQVRTWDALDVVGPYSTLGSVVTSAGGTVSIVSPATDYPDGIVTDDLPVTWATAGTTQAAYRMWLYRGATLVSDTNWVASVATTATVAGMLTDQAHRIDVQVRNAGAVTTNIASRYVTPSFATPEKPVVTATPDVDDGFVLITIENPAPGAPSLGYPEEGYEAGVGTWTPSTGASFAVDATAFHRGAQSGKLTVTAAGQTQYFTRDYTNKVAVTPGQRYTVRMWVYRSVAGLVAPSIDWTDGAGTYLSTSSVGVSVPAATWTRIEATGTAPVGASLAAYGPTMQGSPALGVFLNVDEVVLTAASDRPDVTSNDILRRVVGSGTLWEVIGAAGPDGQFRDYTATAGYVYEYKARGQA